MRRPLWLAAVLVFASALPSAATSITITYTFTGSSGNQTSESPDGQPAGATTSAITRGSEITPFLGADSLNSSAWTSSLARNANDYYEWSVTPAAQMEMDLTGLSFTTRRSDTGPTSLQLYTSVDSYASPIAAATLFTSDTTRLDFALGFTDLTTAVTFRLFGFGATSGAGTLRLGRNGASTLPNNLQLTGDIASVPDDVSSLSLLLLSCAAIVGAYRYQLRPSA